MESNSKKEIIDRIKKNKILYSAIPLELREDEDIIEAERKSGMRVFSNRGYDIIANNFFVDEEITDLLSNRSITTTFESFDQYYNYLSGEIYEKSC